MNFLSCVAGLSARGDNEATAFSMRDCGVLGTYALYIVKFYMLYLSITSGGGNSRIKG